MSAFQKNRFRPSFENLETRDCPAFFSFGNVIGVTVKAPVPFVTDVVDHVIENPETAGS